MPAVVARLLPGGRRRASELQSKVMAAWLVVAVLIIRQGTVAGRPPAGQQQGQPSS